MTDPIIIVREDVVAAVVEHVGTPGVQGAPGEQGPQGARGAEGPTGAQGTEGVAGPQGPQGPLGETGPQGPAGSAGAQGSPGETGPHGAAGPTGPTGPAGAGISPASHDYVFTSESLTAGTAVKSTVAMAKVFVLHQAVTSVAARVRLYVDTASQLADELRTVGTDPDVDVGVIVDAVTTGSALTLKVAPAILGSCATSSIPITVTNLSASTSVVGVTLTAIALE